MTLLPPVLCVCAGEADKAHKDLVNLMDNPQRVHDVASTELLHAPAGSAGAAAGGKMRRMMLQVGWQHGQHG